MTVPGKEYRRKVAKFTPVSGPYNLKTGDIIYWTVSVYPLCCFLHVDQAFEDDIGESAGQRGGS